MRQQGPVRTRRTRRTRRRGNGSGTRRKTTDLRGLWRPLAKPLRNMSRTELVRDLRKFRDVWERLTERNCDLSDDRLAGESAKSLRSLLGFYYSDTARGFAENWVRRV